MGPTRYRYAIKCFIGYSDCNSQCCAYYDNYDDDNYDNDDNDHNSRADNGRANNSRANNCGSCLNRTCDNHELNIDVNHIEHGCTNDDFNGDRFHIYDNVNSAEYDYVIDVNN